MQTYKRKPASSQTRRDGTSSQAPKQDIPNSALLWEHEDTPPNQSLGEIMSERRQSKHLHNY